MIAPASFTAIVPLKSWEAGKSRLHDDPVIRRTLARALALDTILAATRASLVGRVVVITADPVVAADVRTIGATVLDEQPTLVDPLNAAIASGRDWSQEHHRLDPVVVIPADLPALTADDLDAALRACPEGLAFVPDAEGTGTTLLIASAPELLAPAYGPGSAEAHRARGATRIDSAAEGARQDIDTLGDLYRARLIGLGIHTSIALEAEPFSLVVLDE